MSRDSLFIPRATYRLQFNERFRLSDALALVPYFCELGISHIYASPLFRACPHSTHGYDVCDFSRLNPEIGTEADLEKFIAALREKGMGLVLDIVPNHMGIAAPENAWWWDVLKHGRESRYADYFDIDWEPPNPGLRGKILLPVLGDRYEQALERGELKMERDRDEFVLRYFEHKFPIGPGSISNKVSAEQWNANPGALDELIQKQHYRLTFWRKGDSEINYRRFFAVSTLAGLRIEDERVFNDVHALLRGWLEKNRLDGLRVDHPDGLRDPGTYLRRLRALAPRRWIVVEKILMTGESLPAAWPVAGTTGYDFLNQVNGLFIDPDAEKPLTEFYVEFTGEPADGRAIVVEKKRLVLKTLFVAEINRLVELLVQIAARSPAGEHFSREQIRDALIELVANFPVYRAYVCSGDHFAGKGDRAVTERAAAKAREQRSGLAPDLFDFLSGLLLRRGVPAERRPLLEESSPHSAGASLQKEFIARFQQLTGAAMAKGFEDTTFYCFNRFVSLNEVGGGPGQFGVSVGQFHEFCRRQQAHWPHSMLASSTHDTKRSEEVRARLNVLSEIPAQWIETVRRWSALNGRHRKNQLPDRNAEYLFYQTLVGAWPLPLERILAYMEKAAREAKQRTDWNHPNPEYESALNRFIKASLSDKNFVRDLETFIAPLTEAAEINSLAQTLLKLTARGVPDIYQGCELWDFSLVDPDNRRPVDFETRRRLLAEAKNLSAEQIWRRHDEGLPKLWLIHKTLNLRAKRPEAFSGSHEPLFARGDKVEHIIAFARGGVIPIVPRLMSKPTGGWGRTTLKLPSGVWQNEFTGGNLAGEISIGALFETFPVALLLRKEKE